MDRMELVSAALGRLRDCDGASVRDATRLLAEALRLDPETYEERPPDTKRVSLTLRDARGSTVVDGMVQPWHEAEDEILAFVANMRLLGGAIKVVPVPHDVDWAYQPSEAECEALDWLSSEVYASLETAKRECPEVTSWERVYAPGIEGVTFLD